MIYFCKRLARIFRHALVASLLPVGLSLVSLLVVVSLLPLLFYGSFFGRTATATEVLRLHHFLNAQSTVQRGLLEPWAQRIEEASNGRLRIEIFPLMSLGGKAPQLYDQARDGFADIVWTLPGYTRGRFPIIEVFELPFMIATADATSRALQEFSENHLRKEFGETHPLLFHVHARGSFHSRKKPIREIADIRGLKIRGPSRIVTDMLSTLGAVPVGMPVPQVPQSLSRGVIDAAMLPWQVTVPLRSSELVRHHTEFAGARGLYTATFVLTMNKQRYESLPDDLRAILDNESGAHLAKIAGPLYDIDEERGREIARERGNEFILISARDAKKWQQATKPVIASWLQRMREDGYDSKLYLKDARGLIKKYESTIN